MLFRLLVAYAVVKYKNVLTDALQDAFPLQPHEAHVRKCNTLIVKAITIALSFLLDRPIFVYNSFYL